MAWNEPGDNGKNDNKDPWSGSNNSDNRNKKPVDFNAILNQIQKSLSGLLSKNNGNKNKGASKKDNIYFIPGVIIVAIAIWFIMGFYIVQPSEKAVILRWGQYIDTVGSGLHWLPRLIDSEEKVDVQQLRTYTYPGNEDALILTKDQNIVSIAITIQYRINNPKNYLYSLVNPEDSLQEATESILRQVVGQMDFNDIITTGRETIRQTVKQELIQILHRYHSGIEVVNVLVQSAQAPTQVKSAFDDAIKAQEDEKRYINQAKAYVMSVEPLAQGNAQRMLVAANAYKQQVVLQAQAKVASFLALLPEYEKAPAVTRERLYLETMESILKNSHKIVIDGGGNNVFYLPLAELLKQNTVKTSQEAMAKITSVPPLPKTKPATQQFINSRPNRDQAPSYSTGDDLS